MPPPSLDKSESGRLLNDARTAQGVTWAELAAAINRPLVWTVAALLGKHPVSAEDATTICAKLGLGPEVQAALQRQPYRIPEPGLSSDPTIYRLHEAVDVYGGALKELIHEEFGDGIMSAINSRCPSNGGRTRAATASSSPSTASSCPISGDSRVAGSLR
ncbi:cyanate lyase [Mycolicibacterium fluoranthenivorans]|uniref:Cyanate lyase n=1 Tax=Mycolicibacterium fluoranthenivorans TaxID=258505 RepID=A0A7X5ZE57_9MYCO|nr:cyanate lyase [Mycolicibacterium fluoranthenivorans]